MGYTLAAALQSLKIFLERYPGEAIFVDITNETDTDGFAESWQEDFKFFKDYFFKPKDGSTRVRFADLTMADVRGKIVCPYSWNNQGAFFGDGNGGYEFHDEGAWKGVTFDRKIADCKNNIAAAKADTDQNHVYRTKFCMSQALSYNPYSFFVACEGTINDICKPSNAGLGGQQRLGLLVFDFYEYVIEAVQNLVRSNPGCENVY